MSVLRIILVVLALLLVALHANARDGRNLAVAGSGGAAKRVALVIGNDSYSHVPVLHNAVADARAMAEELKRIGFDDVTLKTDVNLAAMKQAVRQFKAGLSGGDEAIFFYSGHGVQLDAANYLLPVDITSDSPEQVKDDAIPLQRLLDDLQDQKVKFALAIIDACRDNPFKGSGKKSIGGTRGLAPTSAANGQMVIFSAGAGQQALDKLGPADKDGNGVFTRVFLQEMQKPGVEVHQLLRDVRSRVVQMARSVKHDQMPAIYDQVEGDFYFKPGIQQASLVPTPVQPVARVKTKEEIEDEYWAEIKDGTDVALFEQYRQAYPSGRYLNTANLRIVKLKKEIAPVVTKPVEIKVEEQAGRAFRDCPECPEMVVIPAGSFEMGSSSGNDKEKPVHRVTIARAYALGKTEVTQGQWKAVMGSNPSRFSNCGDSCPVENVSWDGIHEFLQKLNSKTGKQYRLPSESEWEYACRAGGKHEYCGSDNPDSVAWYKDNSGVQTHPVGQKQANGYGLHDMSGNVWEWVEDSWHDNYSGAPDDGTAWQGDGAKRVLRGGSWDYNSRFTRAANRNYDSPALRIIDVGFRLARTLP